MEKSLNLIKLVINTGYTFRHIFEVAKPLGFSFKTEKDKTK